MNRIISATTAGSLLLVSILERGLFIVCLLVSCGLARGTETCQIKARPTSGCCAAVTACRTAEVESKPKMVCFIPAGSCFLLDNTCKVVRNPEPLMAIVPAKDNNLPDNRLQDYKTVTITIASANISLKFKKSLPNGVHQTIPTTVLRL